MSATASKGEPAQIGPLPLPSPSLLLPSPADELATRAKKRKLDHEEIFLSKLPNSAAYEKSYMHRHELGFVVATSCSDFIITTSCDGHLKFWKKMDTGIEFVKHFKVHTDEITGISVNTHGTVLATISRNKELRIFDICNFDMINIIELDFTPAAVCCVFTPGHPYYLIAISDANSGEIRLLDGKGTSKALHTVSLHKNPVSVIKFNETYNTVVSIDKSGMIEYWSPEPPFDLPKKCLKWEYKSDTDLYTYKKISSAPSSLEFSPDGQMFVTYGLNDRQVRVWKFLTAKLYRVYDESLTATSEMQQTGTIAVEIDDMEFGRRLAIDRELETHPEYTSKINALFDESSNFVLYPTLLGVKIVNVVTNKVVTFIGQSESTRIINIALYQGLPKRKNVVTVEMVTAKNQVLREIEEGDPTLFCTGYKKNRFYLFSRREPDKDDPFGRDVFNEKPSKDEQNAAAIQATTKGSLANQAVIHTTYGDIVVKLFPDYAPRAVENFVTHARSSYYNKHIFHRVIKKFMIQTGDPHGDGTGGESIWGEEFKDEIATSLRHDQPGTLSMANAGPNTNGSQFFITTVKTPWLDGKHTIFGRVIAGMDIVHKIEAVKVDNLDKPMENIHVTSITVQKSI